MTDAKKTRVPSKGPATKRQLLVKPSTKADGPLSAPFKAFDLPMTERTLRLNAAPPISAAKIVPNRFHQNRTVSGVMSMPRSCSRSSTFCGDSGYRTYIITASRMISGLVLK